MFWQGRASTSLTPPILSSTFFFECKEMRDKKWNNKSVTSANVLHEAVKNKTERERERKEKWTFRHWWWYLILTCAMGGLHYRRHGRRPRAVLLLLSSPSFSSSSSSTERKICAIKGIKARTPTQLLVQEYSVCFFFRKEKNTKSRRVIGCRVLASSLHVCDVDGNGNLNERRRR